VIYQYPCAFNKSVGASQWRRSCMRITIRAIGLFLLLMGFISSTMAQQSLKSPADFGKNPEWFPRFYKPYQATKTPEVELQNSMSLLRLIGGGKLRISVSQLKTAVRDNNLDIVSSNTTALYAQTDMLRARGGGAPRGGAGVQIPSSLFAGAIGAGIGSAGGLGSFGGAGGITGGARQVFGAARGSYDPSLSLGFSMDRTDSPLNSIIVSGLPDVVSNTTAFQARFSQAFTTGSSLSVTFNNMRQNSTQTRLLYNPDFVSQFSISLTQNLLSGFGRTIGRRFLEVAKIETKIMQENVRLQVNTTLAQAQSTYWDLVAARDNVRLAERSLAVARKFLEDTKTKEELGNASGLDIITADAEVAARQRDCATAEAALQMREVDLKNMISKNLADLLNSIQIEPTDALPDPKDSDTPKPRESLAAAMINRSEILQSEANLITQDIAIRYTKDLFRPSLLLFANFGSSGLYGNWTMMGANGKPLEFPGGLSQAFRQVRSWSYPEYAIGFSFSINIRNRAAESDAYRAKLEREQSETGLQRTRNSIELEVRKAIIGLVQSKAQVEAARTATELSGQVLAAEEARLLEGAATPYDVIRRQRDLLSAQYAEVQARANYAKALVEMDRATGVLAPLSKN
jgi:outer membrane protein TolC